MEVTIDISVIITLITTAVGATIWISRGLNAIRSELQRIREDFVSNSTCKERRENCPCCIQMEMIKEDFENIKQSK